MELRHNQIRTNKMLN
nr:photosystem II protein L [Thladiantha nudiflora]